MHKNSKALIVFVFLKFSEFENELEKFAKYFLIAQNEIH